MVTKSDVIELLRDQLEDLGIDKFIYRLWFRRNIERALAEAEDDEGMSHEEFVRESDMA